MRLAEALQEIRAERARPSNVMEVGLACGFTPLHLKTFLHAGLLRRIPDHQVEITTGLFGDLAGNLERMTQKLHGLTVIVEWADLDARLGYRTSHGWRAAQIQDVTDTVSKRMDQLATLVGQAAQETVVAVVLPTLPLPPCFTRPTAWGDPMQLALTERLHALARELATLPSVRIVNPQRLDHVSPPNQRLDLKSELSTGFPYSVAHASALAQLLATLIAPPAPKKGIITDLDNTLWRGILGEDGIDGVSWNLEHRSHAHALYQEMLASLADIGVLIAIASKNDPVLVEQALRRPDLVVPPDSLFPVHAGWGSKSEAVRQILAAWNVGADSVVFIDDSPMELAEVASAFPDIECITFPAADDPAVGDLLQTLRDRFGKPSVSAEDRLRTASLKTAQTRFAASNGNVAENFLAAAQAEITLTYDQPTDRAYELVNKTNQFNLNGRRYDPVNWQDRVRDPRCFLVTAAYQDKFGPLGTIAVLSGWLGSPEPVIDVWVMSCRAFSRRIEHHLLHQLFERLNTEALQLQFQGTERNGPMRDFLTAIAEGLDGEPIRISRDGFGGRCPTLYGEVEWS